MISIYTDGSCHTQEKIGAWAAVIFIQNEKIVLSGIAKRTTHQRMELTAVIKALNEIEKWLPKEAPILIYSDSQYLCDLPLRQPALVANNFTTSKGSQIRNKDLLKELFIYFDNYSPQLTKVKAHQKTKALGDNWNQFVDKLSRQLVRQEVKRNRKRE